MGVEGSTIPTYPRLVIELKPQYLQECTIACATMCLDMCTGMCQNMRTDMWRDVCTDVCAHRCVDVHRRACVHAVRGGRASVLCVRRVMTGHVCARSQANGLCVCPCVRLCACACVGPSVCPSVRIECASLRRFSHNTSNVLPNLKPTGNS